MKTSSAKNKGRRLAAKIRDMILQWFPDLKQDDIRVTPSGCTGPDLMLSPAAQRGFPFVVEAKNQEGLNIWAALKQSESHVKTVGEIPLLVFSRNHTPIYCAIRFDAFLAIVGIVQQGSYNSVPLICGCDTAQSEAEIN